MYALRALIDEMYQAGLEAQKKGKPVAWCMLDGGYGAPFLNAMDIECVYPENYGTVCAASDNAAPFLERASAEGYSNYLCGYARNCIGYTALMTEQGQIPPDAPAGGMPKPMLLVSSALLCDARFKWFQALGSYLDAPIWTLELPDPGIRKNLNGNGYERDVAFLVKELKAFAAFLEELMGRKMDWNKFEDDINATIEMNNVWFEVNQLRQARPCPMHIRDFWSSMVPSALGTTNPRAVTELYRKMYDEVKDRINNGISGINHEEKYRMAFIGLPPWHSLGFFDKLAEKGWNFVAEEAYHGPEPIDLSRVKDPVEKLVRYRYQNVANDDKTNGAEKAKANIPDIVRLGMAQVRGVGGSSFSHHRRALRDIMEYQCDGVLLHALLTCRGTTAPLLMMQNLCMDIWKVPSLVIEGDIVDRTLFNPADALKKAEVFEETMAHYRRIRKERGQGW